MSDAPSVLLAVYDRWSSPAAEPVLADQPHVRCQRVCHDMPDAAVWAVLEQAHGYQVAPRTDMTEAWFGSAALIARCPNLLAMSSAGAGFDVIDADACTAAGVAVVNQGGSNSNAVAEHVIGMMLALSKKMIQTDRHMRREAGIDRWQYVGRDIRGKTLGIIGLGNIGSRLAQIAGAFDMHVMACDPYLGDNVFGERGVERVDMATLFERADFVSINCPRNEETLGMVGAEMFARMQPHAYFITAARGGIHDEAALYDALVEGRIAGAGLDVWWDEPPSPAHPLLTLDNVLVTPHNAGVTREALDGMAEGAARQWLDIFAGRRPPRLMNPEVWPAYRRRFERIMGRAPQA